MANGNEMKRSWHSQLRWALSGGILGVAVPAVATVYYLIAKNDTAGAGLILVWPTSLGLMAIGPSTGVIKQAFIWVMCAIPNAALYALLASGLYRLHRVVFGRGL